MPRGSKVKYTNKQKRQAHHIEESYEARGTSKKTALKRAWQTVNKQTGGGEKTVVKKWYHPKLNLPHEKNLNIVLPCLKKEAYVRDKSI